ncbi:MAG: inositol monophosphatase family protein [Actinomycetes bacterium]
MAEDQSPRALLDLAIRAARLAGAVLLDERPAGLVAAGTKSSPTDVVTEMDRRSERLIIDTILAERPGDAVLGEEGGALAGHTAVTWVVDPLDGTVNYLYGLVPWAVSIAAQSGGRTVAGVVHVPGAGHTFTAVLGGGAYLDEHRLQRRPVARLDQALVATGFGYRTEDRAEQARVLAGVLPVVRDIRRAGAASVDLCAVAAGWVDAYYERGLQPWDHGAGALVVSEAGGRVGDLHGGPPGQAMVLAAPLGLYDQLAELLVRLGTAPGPDAP